MTNSQTKKSKMKEFNWIDQALTDLIIFKYEHRFWISQEQLWRKWIRL